MSAYESDPGVREALEHLREHYGTSQRRDEARGRRALARLRNPERRERRSEANLERHLQGTLREELGWLIRRASLRHIHAASSRPLHPLPSVALALTDEAITEESRRAQAVVRHERLLCAQGRSVLPLLDAVGGSVGYSMSSALRLAEASLALTPSDQARIYLGYCLQDGPGSDRAIALLQAVADRPSSRELLSHACESLGHIHMQRGDYSASWSAFQRSADANPRLNVFMGWLHLSARLQDAKLMNRVAMEIDQMFDVDDPSIVSYFVAYESGRRLGLWQWDRSAAGLARTVREQCGPAAHHIFERLS